VSGHAEAEYNGDYARGEDWNGYPHYVKDDTYHLYCFAGSYWQLDDREQAGLYDWYRGGYVYDEGFAADAGTDLDGQTFDWSNAGTVTFDIRSPAGNEEGGEMLTIQGHADPLYNGRYYRRPGPWQGHLHLSTSDNSAHFFFYGGYWQLDNRDQSASYQALEDWYDGGYRTCPLAYEF